MNKSFEKAWRVFYSALTNTVIFFLLLTGSILGTDVTYHYFRPRDPDIMAQPSIPHPLMLCSILWAITAFAFFKNRTKEKFKQNRRVLSVLYISVFAVTAWTFFSLYSVGNTGIGFVPIKEACKKSGSQSCFHPPQKGGTP